MNPRALIAAIFTLTLFIVIVLLLARPGLEKVMVPEQAPPEPQLRLGLRLSDYSKTDLESLIISFANAHQFEDTDFTRLPDSSIVRLRRDADYWFLENFNDALCLNISAYHQDPALQTIELESLIQQLRSSLANPAARLDPDCP